tara:strand:+ start:4521 stop:5690 length:1170 start_codon:yes stop_codon:yes gene_type:complete
MSSGKELQEMEVGTKQSKTAVNANAKPGEPMHSGPQGETPGNTAQIEDLGGPTPDNYAPDNDSAKLKPAGGTLKQVRDVVNKGAKPAEKMGKLTTGAIKSGDEVELEADQEVVSEEPATEEEVTVVAEEEIAEEETTEEEVVAEAPEYTEINIEQDVDALVAGEELSEDFKNKAKTILETAVKGQVSQIKEALVEDYDKRLLEEVEEIKTALNERIDSYLEYVADEWFNENQLAVEGGLKEELTESFMTGLKGLFEEHYVEIPEDKYDVLQSMVDKLDDMETKLNEQIESNVALNKRLAESSSDVILADVSEGLADTQKEKLASLSESVEFESEDKYREKLATLRESYFPTAKAPTAKTESLSEGVDHSGEDVSGSMARYLTTLKGIAG